MKNRMMKLWPALLLAPTLAMAGGAVEQFRGSTFGEIIEVQNTPTQRYIAQGKNFKGGPLLKEGLYTWCEVGSITGKSPTWAPGDHFFVVRTENALANGALNYNHEAGSYILIGVKNSKLQAIDMYCEPAAWQSLSRKQLQSTLRNYFRFTGMSIDQAEKDRLAEAIEQSKKDRLWINGMAEFMQRIRAR